MKFFYDLNSGVESFNKIGFCVSFQEVIFPFWVDDKGFDKWVVFFPGACNRTTPAPTFQRSSFSPLINANVVSLFDPALLLFRNINNAWFCGVQQKHHAKQAARLLKIFFDSRNVDYKDVLFFGTSAGGIPAAVAAKECPGSSACLGNIQVEAIKHVAFERLVPLLYPRYSPEDVFDKFRVRFDLKEQIDGEFRVHIFQNKSDSYHYKNHFMNLVHWNRACKRNTQMHFYVYDDPKVGHGSVGKDKEVALINNILRFGEPKESWASIYE